MRKMDAKLLIPFAILLLEFLGHHFGTEAASVSSPTAPKKKAAGTIRRSVDSEEAEEDWPNIEALLDKEDFPVEKDAHNANKGMTFESAIALDNGSGSVQPWMATRKLGGIAEEQGIFLRKYGRMSGKISFDIRDLNVETAVFSSFLQKPQNRKLLLDVFNYIADLSGQPVCLSRTTVVSIAELGNQQAHQANHETHSQANNAFLTRLDQKSHKSKNLLDEQEQGQPQPADSDLAYSFGRKGVVQIHVSLSGYKCGQSLLEPEKVAKLMQNIIELLEELQEKTGEFDHLSLDEIVRHVVEGLRDEDASETEHHFFREWTQKLKTKWEKAKTKLETKLAKIEQNWEKIDWPEKKDQIKKSMKNIAVWLIRPKHVVAIIYVLVYISGLIGQYFFISLQVLNLFDLDDLLNKSVIEKMGLKMIAHGANAKIVDWAFSPNGVVPLLIRDGGGTAAGQAELDRYAEMEKQSKAEALIRKQHWHEEVLFYKQIIEEVIEHRGKPMDELMEHLVAKLDQEKAKFHLKRQEMVVKLKKAWLKTKQLRLKDVKVTLKKVAVWLVTPQRVNNLILLILALTKADTVTFLSLEVIKAFGLTDAIREAMNELDRKYFDANAEFAQQHGKTAKTVEFFIGKEGVVPLFMDSGSLNDGWAMQERTAAEADLVKMAGNVLINHQGIGVLGVDVVKWLVKHVHSKNFYLEVVQRWNAKIPELWHGVSGKIRQTALEQRKKQREKEEAKLGQKDGKTAKNGILSNVSRRISSLFSVTKMDQRKPKQIAAQKSKSFHQIVLASQKKSQQKKPVAVAKAG